MLDSITPDVQRLCYKRPLAPLTSRFKLVSDPCPDAESDASDSFSSQSSLRHPKFLADRWPSCGLGVACSGKALVRTEAVNPRQQLRWHRKSPEPAIRSKVESLRLCGKWRCNALCCLSMHGQQCTRVADLVWVKKGRI
ncbi:hypothetical protein PG997_005860 [Apiospora hydei]|uniref:Uncharacterized protein n=1 Tax=Apiospora hydei TaxID=1337664 RepID=A0ABR1WR55_9PEZI